MALDTRNEAYFEMKVDLIHMKEIILKSNKLFYIYGRRYRRCDCEKKIIDERIPPGSYKKIFRGYQHFRRSLRQNIH